MQLVIRTSPHTPDGTGVDPVGLAEPDGSSLLTSSTSRATSQSSPLRLLAPRWNSATQVSGASGTSVVPLAHRPGSPHFTCRQEAVSDNSRRVVHPTHPFFLTYVHHATTTASPTRPRDGFLEETSCLPASHTVFLSAAGQRHQRVPEQERYRDRRS